MENKPITIIAVALVVLAAILLIAFFINQKSLSQKQNSTILEDCNTLEYNGENKLNIVFFSTKEQAQKYKDFFFTVKLI